MEDFSSPPSQKRKPAPPVKRFRNCIEIHCVWKQTQESNQFQAKSSSEQNYIHKCLKCAQGSWHGNTDGKRERRHSLSKHSQPCQLHLHTGGSTRTDNVCPQVCTCDTTQRLTYFELPCPGRASAATCITSLTGSLHLCDW